MRRIDSRARLTKRIHNDLVRGINKTNKIVTSLGGSGTTGIDCGLYRYFGPEQYVCDGHGNWQRPIGAMPVMGLPRFHIAGYPDGMTGGGGSPLVRANNYRGSYVASGGTVNPWGAGCTINDFLLLGSGNVNGIIGGFSSSPSGFCYGDWSPLIEPGNTNYVTPDNWDYKGFCTDGGPGPGTPYRPYLGSTNWYTEILPGEGEYWNWPLSKYNEPHMPAGAFIESSFGTSAFINGSGIGISLPHILKSLPDGSEIISARLEVKLSSDSYYRTAEHTIELYEAAKNAGTLYGSTAELMFTGYDDPAHSGQTLYAYTDPGGGVWTEYTPTHTVNEILYTRTTTWHTTGFGFSLLGRKADVWPGTTITKDQWEIVGSDVDGIGGVTPGKWSTIDATGLVRRLFELRSSEYTDFSLMPSVISGYVGSNDMRGALAALAGQTHMDWAYYSNPTPPPGATTMETRGDDWWQTGWSESAFYTNLPQFGSLYIEFKYPNMKGSSPAYHHVPRLDSPDVS